MIIVASTITPQNWLLKIYSDSRYAIDSLTAHLSSSVFRSSQVWSFGSISKRLGLQPVLLVLYFFRTKTGLRFFNELRSLQLVGQRDRVRRGVAQSTSGLCAFSQSVPNIKSWLPRDVTYNSDVSLW